VIDENGLPSLAALKKPLAFHVFMYIRSDLVTAERVECCPKFVNRQF
jgi:hypothetical protein